MLNHLLTYFESYPRNHAPFMHAQFAQWQKERPFAGLKVLHNVPVVTNTLLKIACLVVGGAEVVVSNPDFMSAHTEAVSALKADGISYVEDINSLRGQQFDIYFDCGAELYRKLGVPKLGATEITASGDHFYRTQKLDFPVVSIDSTLTKQFETVFGSAMSANMAIAQLTGIEVNRKSWVIFGFGKIGRGLAYYCVKNHVPVSAIDVSADARSAAEKLQVNAIDPNDKPALQKALSSADIVVTATGKASILDAYPKAWFAGKILANMGVLDEYGAQFSEAEVLNKKLPINFILKDPTPMQYIDPEFYAHNVAALELLQSNMHRGVHNLSARTDNEIVAQWCQYHTVPMTEIAQWFVEPNRTTIAV